MWTFLARDQDSGPNGQVEQHRVDGDPLGEGLELQDEGGMTQRASPTPLRNRDRRRSFF